jgi:ligand-binding sensor domain-containing protein/putative methionine-R-sulfoxide reductase with GAF domain
LPDYHVRLIDERSGVHTNDIVEMLEDKKGFTWILSRNHIERYDGRTATIFKPGGFLQNLYCDRQGNVWCSSKQAIYRFQNDQDGFVPVGFDTSRAVFLRGFGELPDGRLFCCYNYGLQVYDPTLNLFRKLALPSLLDGSLKNDALLYADSSFWLRRGDTLFCYQPGRPTIQSFMLGRLRNIRPLNRQQALGITWDNQTYLCTVGSSPVNLLLAVTAVPLKNPLLVVRKASRINTREYLLTTNNGLLQFNPANFTLRRISLFLEGRPLQNEETVDAIYSGTGSHLFIQHESGILFCNTGQPQPGLIRNNESDPGRKFSNEVNNCTEDNEGNLWFATTNGFTRWNLVTNVYKTFIPRVKDQEFLEYPAVSAICFDGKNLLIGTFGKGLWIFDPHTEQFRRPVMPADTTNTQGGGYDNTFIGFIKLQHNGELLISFSRNVVVMDKHYKGRKVFSMPYPYSIFTAVQGPQHQWWIGTLNGLVCLDSQYKVQYRLDTVFKMSKHVYSLATTQDGKLLVGSKGLYLVDNRDGRQVVQAVDPFFNDKTIRIIYQDRLGYCWISTDDALYRYDLSGQYIRSFPAAAEVKGYHIGGLYKATDGTIFLCGLYGVTYFKPEAIPLQPASLKVYINKVSVNDQWRKPVPAESLQLRYFENTVTWGFVSPYYENPSGLAYRYQLQGIDKGWVYAGKNNEARYSGLKPGHYTFKVAASTDGVNWFESAEAMPISIAPPFWLTAWFLLLCVAVSLLLIWFTYRYIQKKKRTKEIQQMLGYFANSAYGQSTAEDIAWDIARNCIASLHFEDCVIYLAEEEHQRLIQKAAYGPKNPRAFEILDPIVIPFGKGIVGHVAQTGKAELIDDTTKDARYIVDDRRRFAELTVPILHDNKVIGIIDAEHHRKRFFTRQHLDAVVSIAALCSAKISHALALEAMQKSKLQLMELHIRMAESKFLNLRLQMNPHFLFNSLNSIQHLIVSQQTNKAYRYLTIFSKLLRSLLQHAAANFIRLDEELRILQSYLDLESLRFEESFHYEITVDERLEQETVLIPSLLVQPFAENAIWHGLMNKQGSKRLHIAFSNHHEEYLTCIIEDNGVGRQQAAATQRNDLSSMVHESKGILIIRERLALLQEKTGKPAEIDIVDLTDEEAMPCGTRVIIVIPFYNREEP